MDEISFDARKARAAGWFRSLRDEIVAAFEGLEDRHDTGPLSDRAAGRFELRETQRTGPDGEDAGGGLMSVMRDGRVFEKVGVNVSEVHGTLGEQARRSLTARKAVPGLDDDPRFWASGISLVAHMQNPHVPAVHLNTRMFWTPGAWWFGGGSDLNPCIEYPDDTAAFHAALQRYCDPHGADLYPRYKAWADDYFYIPHRKRARGVGGIFAFTRDVGRAFLPAFMEPVERRRQTLWTDADRDTQLVHRGLYAEYNLVYDRGTKFGLQTSHDPDAVLMSLPPFARWV